VRPAPSIDEHLAGVREGGADLERRVPQRVRDYLSDVRAYLRELHERSSSGRLVNEAHSDLTDRMVRRLFALAEEALVADGGDVEAGLCVVAVGGYARREMSVYSDVDLLVLYRDGLTPYVTSIAERLQYWLWDAGLSVGCATRTIEETLELGREDVTVRTAILAARYLCGDGEFFHDFALATRRGFIADPAAFVDEQIEIRGQRHLEFGESLFLLQPNLKEGAGALRDYHGAYWVARAAEPGTRHLDDLLHFGLLTESEMAEYRESLDFLWRVRNDLHLRCGRANDQMSFELQEQIAASLGYGERGDDEAELPVERFMRDYYTHARRIQNYSELVVEQCAARVRPRRMDRARVLDDGFRVRDGHLEVPSAAFLREDPGRLLTALRASQRNDVPLSRMALRLLRESLDCIGDDFRRDPRNCRTFCDILDADRRVMRSLLTMNEIGLLAAFLPEWEHIVCRWQHVIYHTYTVDVHSIFLVEELRRLWDGKYEDAMPELTELMQGVEDRPALFLGCLLHDIGKGFGGHHSEVGTERARHTLERLGFPEERQARVLFVVRQHLLMSHLAQRRDLSDPKLILEFAQLCGDRINLRNLYLATFADIRASTREAWNDWKGQLLRELYERAAELLETGADADKAMELLAARVERRRATAGQALRADGVDPGKVEAYFDSMPRRYFTSHTPPQIARHARVVLEAGDGPVTCAFREMRGGFTEMILCARDVHGLYGTVAGTITACGINILSSHVYTNREGTALEIYRLTTPSGGTEERQMAFAELTRRLEDVLAGKVELQELLGRRRLPVGHTQPPARQEPVVLISNEVSDFYTVIDVNANDRIGLLYGLASTIGRYGLEIYISKAATIQDQVTDTFYVKTDGGAKLRDPVRIGDLQEKLLEVTGEEDGAGG